MIVNKLNGKCYVGSTRSIKVRLYNYFNLTHHITQKGRPISSAILKYGLVNFAVPPLSPRSCQRRRRVL
jgi:group I intron endonuclease